jgi:membrane protease YdiL (CAAX protease family)
MELWEKHARGQPRCLSSKASGSRGETLRNDTRSIAEFFILVFVISIPFWLLASVFPVQLLPGLPVSALNVLAPAIAAVVMATRSGQFAAARRLLARSFDFNRVRNKYWYLIFVLFNPAIAVFAYVAMRSVGTPVPRPSPLTLAVVPMFAAFFVAALAEEIGWTGFATEPLQRRWGTFWSGVSLGLVWAIFHFVALRQANRSLEWIAWWSLGTISLRTLMVWLYRNAGDSVFAATIFHAMINLSWQLFPVNGSFYDPRLFSLATLCFALVVIGAQRLVSHGRMSAA